MVLVNVVVVFVLAVAGVVAGTRLAEAPSLSRKALAASGALLIAISLFWVAPESGRRYGWGATLLWVAVGFVALWVVDHYVYPICPTCSHTHHHEACHEPLHGFATPLLIAIGIHSFLDGWGLAASQEQGDEIVRVGVLLGIALHKLPEGLAIGAIVRAAVASHWKAILTCVIAESLTLAGGLTAIAIAARMGAAWEGILLSAAAGTFIYLGYHAIEGQLHRHAVRYLRRSRDV